MLMISKIYYNVKYLNAINYLVIAMLRDTYCYQIDSYFTACKRCNESW